MISSVKRRCVKPDKAILIFSGYNPRAVIALIRTLEKNNIPYGIIAKSFNDDIYHTDYKDRVMATRKTIELIDDELRRVITATQKILRANEYIIAPSTEALNRYFLENKDLLDSMRCKLPVVERVAYELVSDKEKFGRLCAQSGINVPSEFPDLKTSHAPFVAKPRSYMSTNGRINAPVLINNNKDMTIFKNDYNVEDFYFQEYVGGQSKYLLYYFYKDGKIDKFSQVNYIQQPGGKSIIGATNDTIHNNEISNKFEELFASMRFFGLVMVEVKYFKNKYFMIEANPRLWGPSQLFVDAGVNLFESLLFDLGLLENRPVFSVNNVRYFWNGGIVYKNGSPQVVYHEYDETQFEQEYDNWLNADIYNRKDTIKLYNIELERGL